MPDGATSLYADDSTGMNRFYVPLQLRLRVSDELHSLPHPGVRGTKQLVGSKYVSKGMNKDTGAWCKDCTAILHIRKSDPSSSSWSSANLSSKVSKDV
ncbi:hypothetical protein AVEN_122637-1 [Araneus ventricosus]|uniref:Integrase zinc-binding domain-containing protein n=1 Tax=Araneus ventricosus TaxID=182803 RepID=A0A4Y2FGA0_ARAVE|nr:hypothetical protein AVEN_122637-1 [Araneus ventricosus]